MAAHNIPTNFGKRRPNSHQDHITNQNVQVFGWVLDTPIIYLNNALFLSLAPRLFVNKQITLHLFINKGHMAL